MLVRYHIILRGECTHIKHGHAHHYCNRTSRMCGLVCYFCTCSINRPLQSLRSRCNKEVQTRKYADRRSI